MADRTTRRVFLATAAAGGAGMMIGLPAEAARTYRANESLDIAVIGVGNRGRANLDGVADQNIVALCDVDDRELDAACARFPAARRENDFRRLLSSDGFDAVVISTTDHTHAPAAAMALKSGRHVYCEKPLTHTVYEARTIAQLAVTRRLATQMGTQIHAGSNYRRVVEAVRSGAIGAVTEVHVWCGGGYGGFGRPTDRPDVPSSLHWDLWLGPAPERPYHPLYAPHQWRCWWDFGNGTLGDMACHHMDLPFWALGLRCPATVEADGPPVHPETTPPWLIVRYTFPIHGRKEPLPLTWYNGDRRPPHFSDGRIRQPWGNGTLFVGEKGMLLADYDRFVLLPESSFKGWEAPARTIPDSIGHHAEWVHACKTGSPTTCNFDYAGALTEAVLLGNVAYRSMSTLRWDARNLRARDPSEARAFLQTKYRPGWEI